MDILESAHLWGLHLPRASLGFSQSKSLLVPQDLFLCRRFLWGSDSLSQQYYYNLIIISNSNWSALFSLSPSYGLEGKNPPFIDLLQQEYTFDPLCETLFWVTVFSSFYSSLPDLWGFYLFLNHLTHISPHPTILPLISYIKPHFTHHTAFYHSGGHLTHLAASFCISTGIYPLRAPFYTIRGPSYLSFGFIFPLSIQLGAQAPFISLVLFLLTTGHLATQGPTNNLLAAYRSPTFILLCSGEIFFKRLLLLAPALFSFSELFFHFIDQLFFHSLDQLSFQRLLSSVVAARCVVVALSFLCIVFMYRLFIVCFSSLCCLFNRCCSSGSFGSLVRVFIFYYIVSCTRYAIGRALGALPIASLLLTTGSWVAR